MKSSGLFILTSLLLIFAVCAAAFCSCSAPGTNEQSSIPGGTSVSASELEAVQKAAEVSEPIPEVSEPAEVSGPIPEVSEISEETSKSLNAKIDPGVFDTEPDENGKYLISVFFLGPELDVSNLNSQAEYTASLLGQYGISAEDTLFVSKDVYRAIVYADREKIGSLAEERLSIVIEPFVTTVTYDPRWESKISEEVYGSELNEDGKYCLYINLKEAKKHAKKSNRDLATQTNEDFILRHGIELKDLLYFGKYTYSIVVYADAAQLEEYAKDAQVTSISYWKNETPVNE